MKRLVFTSTAGTILPIVGMRWAPCAVAQRVATAPEGMRNATLNAETFSLARLVEAGVLSAIELAEAMAAAALDRGIFRR